jgi:SAM-dependent methyltransferase
MRPFQAWARRGRIRFFLPWLRPGDRILEIGPGDGWFRRAVEGAIPVGYLTVDPRGPADICGDVRNWPRLGLETGSFDAIIAFEVVEHTPCFPECHELLRSGGRLLVTTPMPHFDWLLKLFEILRLTQERTSKHTNLVVVTAVPGFMVEKARHPFGIGQWAVLRKVDRAAA